MAYKTVFKIAGLILASAWASTCVQGSISGGRQLEVLEIGFAAAPLAMAESITASSENPFAGIYNPAGVIGLKGTQLHSIHSHLSDGIEIFSLNMVRSIREDWVMGVTWTQFQTTGVPIVPIESATPTQDISPTSKAVYSSHALTAFTGIVPLPNLSVGLSVSGFLSRLSGESGGNGIGITVTPGMRYEVSPGWSLGAHIQNLFSSVSWESGEQETVGRFVHIGSDFSAFGAHLTTEYVFDPSRIGSGDFRAGVSVPFLNLLTLRAGMYPTHFTAGVGLDFKNVVMDYVFTGDSLSRLSDSSRFSLGVRF